MEVRTAYTYAADLRRVIDGDTLEVAVDLGFRVSIVQRIRLLDIDAPERHTQPGRAATAFVVLWMSTHARAGRLLIHTRKPADTDRYGRYLAHVHAPDGRNLNTDLLTAGHATPHPG